jgi:FkbM family methyltransferase
MKNKFYSELIQFLIIESSIVDNSITNDSFKIVSLKRRIYFYVLRFIQSVVPKLKIIVLSKKSISFTEDLYTNFDEFSFLYDNLADDDSRKRYINCVAYKLFGSLSVRLKLPSDYFDKAVEPNKCIIDKDLTRDKDVQKLFDLSAIGYRGIKLWYCTFGVAITFLLRQYDYKKLCVVKKGDIVIDAGGCYGDTALYFAHLSGETGKVFTFEFVPSNIKVLEENLNLNPTIINRIEIVPNPLDSETGKTFYYFDAGPGTRISLENEEGYESVKSVSIDDFVIDKKLSDLSFLKMDIEGAELSVLHGAKDAIIKFKPKMAISIYHKLEDFYEIPKFIDNLNLGYKFYFDYYRPNGWEMVLYCVPTKK